MPDSLKLASEIKAAWSEIANAILRKTEGFSRHQFSYHENYKYYYDSFFIVN